MASLAAIRAGIKTTLIAALGEGVEVYDTVPGSPVLPCVCVVPDTADFHVAMVRGVDTWYFDLIVLVPSTDSRVGQNRLDPFVTGAGPLSIRQAIFDAGSLGLTGTASTVSAMSNYGGSYDAVSVDHIGATLRLIVHTPGTA